MKKLLVFTLVLGIASLATAGLDLSNEGTSLSVSASSEGSNYAGYWLVVQGAGKTADASSPTLWGDGGVLWYSVDDPATLADYAAALAAYYGYANVVDIIEFELVDSAEPFDPIPDGVVLSGISADVGSTVTLMTLDLEYIDSLVVPEPATMALLGLGGLVLARRKK